MTTASTTIPTNHVNPSDIVATEIPMSVKREAEALGRLGCTAVTISAFDRNSHIWTITFTRDRQSKALLMWCVEVDA